MSSPSQLLRSLRRSVRPRHLPSAIPLTLLALGPVACALTPIEEEAESGTSETSEALVINSLTLRTVVVPRFVGATNNGGSTVVATATAAQAWETFALDDINGGTLNSGDTVTIRTGAGQYFRAVNGGGAALDATATAAQGWETFTIVKASGSGAIKNGDAVGFRTSTGHYLRAVNGGGAAIDALGAALSTWEQFTLGGLVSAPVECANGIRGDGVCCSLSCGTCGGSGCGDRVGGSAECCAGPIRDSGVSCSGNAPPCVLSGSGGSTGSGGSSGGTGRKLVNATFQNQSTGTYTLGKVSADFGSSPSWDNGLSQGRASVVQEGSNKFLRVTYPANQFGPANGGVQFNVDLKGDYEELFFSYRVRFAPGFDFVNGGKLPGLVGGSSPSGCTTDLYNGFSARNMWRGGGIVEQYMYYPDRTNRCGDDWNYSGARFVPGTWHTVEHRIRMGTKGQSNGVMQGWLDGKLLLNRTNVRWRTATAGYAIDTLYFSTFFGGSDSSWAPKSAQRVDFDDFIVSDQPIAH
ncbi:MAG TPA: hypothetical protein VLC09_04020 [Polyangiaceae bacterium]|nr:hypothetical protein [Polyangiaceae bacterium]